MMDWSRELIVCGAGCAAGMMNAIAGGGTMVTFPALLSVGLSGMQANMTSTVSLFLGMPFGVWSFRKHLGGIAHWLYILAPLALVGGLAGGLLLLWAGASVFDRVVPWLLLLATVLFMSNGLVQRWVKKRRGEPSADHKLGPWSVAFLSLVAVYAGYFGAGVGILMLAALSLLGLRDMNQMNALKAILAMLMNFSAVVYFIIQGTVAWHWAWWLMAGSVVGYFVGGYVGQRIPALWVRALVVIIGLGICAQLFLKQIHGPH